MQFFHVHHKTPSLSHEQKRFLNGNGVAVPAKAGEFEKNRKKEPELLEAQRYSQVVDSLQKNKFHFLLDKTEPALLRKHIVLALEENGTDYDEKILSAAIDYVQKFYGSKLRKDKITPAWAHPLSVALGAAKIGLDSETVLTAPPHDLLEDSSKQQRVKIGEDTRRICGENGKKVMKNVRIITHNLACNYENYLRDIYRSENIQLMILKAVDTIENLKTLYFEGCPAKLRRSVTDKALMHSDLWRKINKPFFELMFALIKDNAPVEFSERIKKQEEKSHRQKRRERHGSVDVNWRGELKLNLIRELPNAESPVITIYHPESFQSRIDYIELEFPGFVGDANNVHKLLSRHMPPELSFRKVQSKLPPIFECTTIFRTPFVPAHLHDIFDEKIDEISAEVKNIHRQRYTEEYKTEISSLLRLPLQ